MHLSGLKDNRITCKFIKSKGQKTKPVYILTYRAKCHYIENLWYLLVIFLYFKFKSIKKFIAIHKISQCYSRKWP